MTADRTAGYIALARLDSLAGHWDEQARRTRLKSSSEAVEGRHRSAEICRASAVLLEQCSRELRALGEQTRLIDPLVDKAKNAKDSGVLYPRSETSEPAPATLRTGEVAP